MSSFRYKTMVVQEIENSRFWDPKYMLAALLQTSYEEFKEEEKNYKAYIDKQQLTNNLIHSV